MLGPMVSRSYSSSLVFLATVSRSLVHPFLSYGIIIWGATYPTYIKRLEILTESSNTSGRQMSILR